MKSKETGTIISLSTLTGSFVASSALDLTSFEQVMLLIKYKKDAAEANSILNMKIEYSEDANVWYQETYDDGTASITAGVESSINFVPCVHLFKAITVGDYDYISYELPTNCRRVRISVKETSVIANYGTVEIKYIARWV